MKDLLIVLIISLLYSCGLADKKKNKKALEIEKGMNMEEVSSILGKPTDILPGYSDESKIRFYYELSSTSEDVLIYFDTNSKLVTNISLPKGYDKTSND